MSSGIRLIVGLNNPGAEYANTRHNAGEWFTKQLADIANVTLRPYPKFSGLYAHAKLSEHECHLLLPTTYMNLSGQSVQAFAQFFKLPPQSILVAHDEIDLPAGTTRLKKGGGHGGHNGLRDIIARLSSNDFYRLRIGVGRPALSTDVVSYVLAPPKSNEKQVIMASLEAGETIVPLMLAGQFQKAMNQLHTDSSS